MTDRKTELQTLKADLQARLRRLQAHQRREDGAINRDFEEQAVETQNDEVVDGLEQESRLELSQVEHALERIDAGEGDDCERCGHPIDPRRLQILPYTTLCVKCAEQV
ncbi:TraR/DksA family transcriptional regulator [Marinobacter xestospongiae]|uniref:TraR/DksA family transcriptional regulator n=1 Tax=Marinobacter xestospongiae TaxID=994319 RepID=UPI002004F531|nr:TraR/DksA family transcriptional regulator [Marinobacter xestospongiae]MCK7565896.1 TraR/DksA family transcriptional regulator [Marinobacter xestospongiae]